MNGFSLLECLVALIFVAIVALAAVGSHTFGLHQYLTNSYIDQLVHDLAFARQQAILRRTLVSLCPTLNFSECADSNDWTAGYLVYAQADLLLIRKNSQGILSNSRKLIEFAPNGFSHSTNSTFTYTLGEIERHVIINLQGRIRVE